MDLCRKGRNLDAVNQFYSPRIVSIESSGSPEMPAEMSGIDAIRGKHEWWAANNDVHSMEVDGPYLGESQFAVQFTFDSTFKPTGQRRKLAEIRSPPARESATAWRTPSGARLSEPRSAFHPTISSSANASAVHSSSQGVL